MFRTGIKLFKVSVQTQIRYNSTKHIPPRPRFRDLLRTPVFKSMFLTFVFGTVVVDVMKGRRDLEALKTNHHSKFIILEELIEKLKNGESVDIARELKLANTLGGAGEDVTDIEIDEQIENFFKLAESEEEVTEATEKVVEPEVPGQKPKLETSKFL